MMIEAKKLKVVWEGSHHDFDITSPPTCFENTLVVPVSEESIDRLLDASEHCNPAEGEKPETTEQDFDEDQYQSHLLGFKGV